MPVHHKSGGHVPPGYFAWEAAGLRWLADAAGARVVEVLDVGEHHLDLAALDTVSPTREAAAQFGAALARTHRGGAPAYGSPPEHWVGDGWFGPLSQPLPLSLHTHEAWGVFWARERLVPITRVCWQAGVFSADESAVLERVASRCADGRYDTGDPPARIHGDLWSGNVMWTSQGATLIDPSAHGGHREYDLAMLELFGAPHLGVVRAAYDATWPLATGWRERTGLHQLHALAVHALLFGGGYGAQTLATARRYA
ncbi:MAG: fructosamine kinase family protein [Dermatophilaceae bacterium]